LIAAIADEAETTGMSTYDKGLALRKTDFRRLSSVVC
jgi:hypothetical protein